MPIVERAGLARWAQNRPAKSRPLTSLVLVSQSRLAPRPGKDSTRSTPSGDAVPCVRSYRQQEERARPRRPGAGWRLAWPQNRKQR
jgi:hypothetical protein